MLLGAADATGETNLAAAFGSVSSKQRWRALRYRIARHIRARKSRAHQRLSQTRENGGSGSV
jgi:hypothetical protein